MTPDTVRIVVIVVVALVAAAIAWYLLQTRRSKALKDRFGPEYERTVREAGSPRRGEAMLEQRAERVARLDIHSLSPADSARFSQSWFDIQKRFVDAPERSVAEADRVVRDVMVAKGYPMEDFDRRAEDISVHYPHVVRNFRAARAIADRSRDHQATTEELRQALVYYRNLFDELLEATGRRRVV
ncbi:MAG TPA: hypothetical protein VFA98_09695 [Thermoanaerobaculia bacterium]|nr:hypothetical protein [Thermoanaerobaculia bacterium]